MLRAHLAPCARTTAFIYSLLVSYLTVKPDEVLSLVSKQQLCTDAELAVVLWMCCVVMLDGETPAAAGGEALVTGWWHICVEVRLSYTPRSDQ